jgi:hypothetical protein
MMMVVTCAAGGWWVPLQVPELLHDPPQRHAGSSSLTASFFLNLFFGFGRWMEKLNPDIKLSLVNCLCLMTPLPMSAGVIYTGSRRYWILERDVEKEL